MRRWGLPVRFQQAVRTRCKLDIGRCADSGTEEVADIHFAEVHCKVDGCNDCFPGSANLVPMSCNLPDSVSKHQRMVQLVLQNLELRCQDS